MNSASHTTRFGKVRTVPGGGYQAFYPETLPTKVDVARDTVGLLANAEGALGRLAGAGRLLPNPHFLIAPYLLTEAIASTRIEGTQASLEGVLEAEAAGDQYDPDVEEVVNYVSAMEKGLERLSDLPFSTRLIRDMHAIILDGVRGREQTPGKLRTSQNWIGPPGATLETASFVPPPPDELGQLLTDWERFAHTTDSESIPDLVRTGLLHYQFETIHPFLDGNGRLGRLLIVFYLVWLGKLPQPLLYLSPYFEQNRDRYYETLQNVREKGDLDAWLRFFLVGVEKQANHAVTRAERLIDMRESYRARIVEAAPKSRAAGLVDHLVAHPIITGRMVQEDVGGGRPAALAMLEKLVEIGILEEMKPGARNQRRFRAPEVVELALRETELFPNDSSAP